MKKTFFIAGIFAALCILDVTAFTKTSETSETAVRLVQDNAQRIRPSDSYAEIKFDSVRHDFGKFSEKKPIVKCSFTFTNTGTAPLVIHQALASCGCTVPSYPKSPIKPGEKGKIDITYNGTGKFPGKFIKSVTVRTNAKNEVVRLVIEGEMLEK